MTKKVGTVYWITGLSGAGKTTIGSKLYQYLKEKRDNVIFLDGDILRQVYQATDYSLEGRRQLAFQHARLCKMLSEQGMDVVICLIAMFDDCRSWNSENIAQYKEIYLEVPIDILIQRDQKGLYSGALKKEKKNVMGMDIPFDAPKNPDLVLVNDGSKTPQEILSKIIEKYGI